MPIVGVYNILCATIPFKQCKSWPILAVNSWFLYFYKLLFPLLFSFLLFTKSRFESLKASSYLGVSYSKMGSLLQRVRCFCFRKSKLVLSTLIYCGFFNLPHCFLKCLKGYVTSKLSSISLIRLNYSKMLSFIQCV